MDFYFPLTFFDNFSDEYAGFKYIFGDSSPDRINCIRPGMDDKVKILSLAEKIISLMMQEDSEMDILVFASVLDEHVSVEFGSLASEKVPALLSIDEEIRRMEEMMRMYGISQPTPPDKKLILNTASPLISKLDALCESNPELATELAEYIYKLAMLSQKKFSAKEMQEFMDGSYNLLMKL